MEPQKSVFFNGVEYRLMGARKYYLSQERSNKKRKNAKGLHAAIWEHYNGMPVPKGHHVHHKDENTFNNDISNLELIKKGEHLSEHSRRWHAENRDKSKEMIDKARIEASKWHGSEEGRKWHSEHGKKTWENKHMYYRTCEFCKKDFKSPFPQTKYCSQDCRTKASRERTKLSYAGVCVMCGSKFTAIKLSRTKLKRKTCSRTCQNRLVHRNRKDRQR